MRRIREIRLSEMVLVALALVALTGAGLNVAGQFLTLAKKNLLERYAYNGEQEPIHRSKLAAMSRARSFAPLTDRLALAPDSDAGSLERMAFIRVLQVLSGLPTDVKQRSAVVVPRSQLAFYWGDLLLRSADSVLPACASTPFLVPAVSGLALLDGFPPPECEARAYGYQYYARFEDRMDFWKHGFDLWCARARDSGLDRLYVLTLSGAEVGVAQVPCTRSNGFVVRGSIHSQGPSQVVRPSGIGERPDPYWTSEPPESARSGRALAETARMTLEFEVPAGTVALDVPFTSGPRTVGLVMRLEDAESNAAIAEFKLPAPSPDWAIWRIETGGRGNRFRLVALDEDQHEESWLRVGVPRAIRAEDLPRGPQAAR